VPRYTVDSFTTASVGAGATVNFDRVITSNYVDLYKIKITPSGGTGTTEFFIHKAAARAPADLIYASGAWNEAVFYDPVEDDGGVYAERAEGFVCRYEDVDVGLNLHCRIKNNDAAPRTYNIEISIDLSPFAANVIGVPDGLKATASANGLSATSKVTASLNNATINQAEFRAIRLATGALLPPSQDLRTAAEGGTFTHNGTTQLIVTGISANAGGSEYRFISSGAGRWYYAWRLKNSVGWSHWTDGNDTPSVVVQWFETSSNSDTGPPDDWQVTIEQGPTPNTVIVRATRPRTNGNVIKVFAVQVKDSSTGSWRLLDANAGAAVTYYDGSGSNHDLDPATGLISNGGGGWGTASIGDLILMDVRGNGSFNIDHCIGDLVKSIAGSDVGTYNPLKPLASAHQTGGIYDQIRVKIVKPMWNWNSEGYMGGWRPNGGYWDTGFTIYQRFFFPDFTTKEFVSDPIPINPAATTVQARVWFCNGYSVSDGNIIISSNIIGGEGILGDGFIWTSFNDRDWWIPVIQNGDNVSLVLNADGTITGTSLVTTTDGPGIAGASGRFRIFPSPNGQVIVRAKFTVTSFAPPTSGQVAGTAAMILDMEGANATGGTPDSGVQGFGGANYDDTGTQKLRLCHMQRLSLGIDLGGLSTFLGSVATSTVKDTIAMPATPFDLELRLTIDEDTVNLAGGGCTVWKRYEYQINGGGWNDVPLPAPAETMYPRRATNTAIRGYRPVLAFCQNDAETGDSITLKEFEVTKGIVARF
jgi:hypothetical protein